MCTPERRCLHVQVFVTQAGKRKGLALQSTGACLKRNETLSPLCVRLQASASYL
jgi:hypothetical protein